MGTERLPRMLFVRSSVSMVLLAPRKLAPWVSVVLLLNTLCFGGEATAGDRIRLEYDETLWNRRPATALGKDVVQLVSDEGSFTVLRTPESAIAGGMSSAESRRKYFAQLSKTFVRTEDIQAVTIAGKPAFEYFGKRETGNVEYRMRVVLVVDAGDVLILISNAFGKDPMSVPSIISIWRSITFLPQN